MPPVRLAIPQPFETVDHTADTGVRVTGRSAEETLARLVLAHAQMLTGGVAVEPTETFPLELAVGSDPALLAIDTLRALHQVFATRHVVAHAVTVVELSQTTARLEVEAGDYVPARHPEGQEVKAVTFHQARFERAEDGWLAQVLFDV